MIKFICNKIARDKTRENMTNDGIAVNHTILHGEELVAALKMKLIEEATEAAQTTNRQQLTSELADVYAVIDALCKTANISKEEIIAVQQELEQKRGGFFTGLFISTIEINESNPWVKHFRASPEKYPEK